MQDAVERTRQITRFTLKNPQMFGRLVGNYLFGTGSNDGDFTVAIDGRSRTYSRKDLETIVEQVARNVEFVEGCKP